MIDAALNGYGIAYVPDNIVADHVKSGDLVVALDEWSPLFDGYFIYYPNTRQNSAAFKVIVDVLRYRDANECEVLSGGLTNSKHEGGVASNVSSEQFARPARNSSRPRHVPATSRTVPLFTSFPNSRDGRPHPC